MKKNLHNDDMLLHIPLTMAEGFKVGSATTSTCSAPLGSSSTSTLKSDLATGGGGGGGGGDVPGGDEVALFKRRELLLLFSSLILFSFSKTTEFFGGDECRRSNFVFSMSSSELRREWGPDEIDACGQRINWFFYWY